MSRIQRYLPVLNISLFELLPSPDLSRYSKALRSHPLSIFRFRGFWDFVYSEVYTGTDWFLKGKILVLVDLVGLLALLPRLCTPLYLCIQHIHISSSTCQPSPLLIRTSQYFFLSSEYFLSLNPIRVLSCYWNPQYPLS